MIFPLDLNQLSDSSIRRKVLMRISCIVAYGLIAIALAPAIAEQKATNLTDAIARASATSWTGTWATADMHDNSGKTFTDQALRQIVRISVGGKSVRLKISNRFGTQPLRVEDVHLALRKSGSTIIESSDRQLLFEGKAALNIPAGASVLSDRVAFDAPALAELAISMYLPGTSGAATFHASAHETSYVETGDANSAAQMKDGKTSKSIYFLTGVDIEGRSLRGSVVTLGGSITEGYNAADDSDRRWPDQLARRLVSQDDSIGVLDLGISGNRLLVNGAGESAENRFERDVLDQPNVRWVIFSDDPINDLGSRPSPSGEALIAGLQRLIARAHERNIRFICSTLTPFEGAKYWTPAEETERQKVNSFIRGDGSGCDGIVDQDTATHDPAHPTRYLAAYDSGDHLHPNDAGHKAIADAIDLKIFMAAP
jgi:lysophospholipase L1-like esterase